LDITNGIGGQQKIRPLWRHYYEACAAVLLLIDAASSQDDIDMIRDELYYMMETEAKHLSIEKPVMIVVSKLDVAIGNNSTLRGISLCSVRDVEEALQLWRMPPGRPYDIRYIVPVKLTPPLTPTPSLARSELQIADDYIAYRNDTGPLLTTSELFNVIKTRLASTRSWSTTSWFSTSTPPTLTWPCPRYSHTVEQLHRAIITSTSNHLLSPLCTIIAEYATARRSHQVHGSYEWQPDRVYGCSPSVVSSPVTSLEQSHSLQLPS
jgi:hypothetical protein